MCSLFINDLDAGAGRMGDATQYTVNNQVRYGTAAARSDGGAGSGGRAGWVASALPRLLAGVGAWAGCGNMW